MSSSTHPTPRLIRVRPGARAAAPASTPRVALVEELTRHWKKGERLLVEHVLAAHPEIKPDTEQVVQLLCEEICLRQEFGEPVVQADFVRRFPHLVDEIQVVLECHSLFTERTRPRSFPRPGESLGGFHLLTELGRGAASRVYLAHQLSLSDRPVVLKVVPPHTAEHFCLARLQHTHIVPLYSTHLVADGAWLLLCMPYFGSKTLASVLERLKSVPLAQRTGGHLLDVLDDEDPGLPELPRHGSIRKFLGRVSYGTAICWIGICLAEALQFAHEHDLVHLDVKPSNLLLTAEGQPMLLDFHLAQPELPRAAPGPLWLGGTVGYMSPEQRQVLEEICNGNAASQAVNARSDIYSLGVLLCEALGADVPTSGPCEVPRHPSISRGLHDILTRCLAHRADDRYDSAAALAEDLRRHLNDQPLVGVANRSLLELWRKWRRRSPQLLLRYVVAAMLVSMAVLGVILWTQWRHGSETPRQDMALPTDAGAVAEHVHDLAERLRRLHAEDGQTVDDGLLAEAAEVWQQRHRVLKHVVNKEDATADLLDVMLLSNDIRLARETDDPALPETMLAAIEEAEQLFGGEHLFVLERSRHCAALGRVEESEMLAQRAAATPPVTAWEHYRTGRKALFDRDHVRARSHLARATALMPKRFWFQFHHGVCAYRCGDDAEAARIFSACITLRSGADEALCHCNRAMARARLGQEQEALADYDRALTLDASLGAALANRGALHHKRGAHEQARDDLVRALERGADADLTQYNLALVHLALKDRKSAEACLEAIRRRNPHHAEAAKLRLQLQAP